MFSGDINFHEVLSYLRSNPNDVIWQSSMGGGPMYGGEFANTPCDWFCAALPEVMDKLTYEWHNSIPENYSEGVIHIRDYIREITSKIGANLSMAQFYAHVYRKQNGTPHGFREITKYWEDFDSKTGEIKSRKDEWPFWAEKIDFKRLAEGEEEE